MQARFVRSSRPVKFQVKVLVCLGMSNADTDRIDHRLPQKLRWVRSSAATIALCALLLGI